MTGLIVVSYFLFKVFVVEFFSATTTSQVYMFAYETRCFSLIFKEVESSIFKFYFGTVWIVSTETYLLGIIWSQTLMSMRCCLDVSFCREVESSNPKYLAWKVWNFWNFFFRPQLIWNH
jgi:alpha-D-ribose 1-methylphosphonate 5-phosphate C-P lyase